jgi:hypothetical protein
MHLTRRGERGLDGAAFAAELATIDNPPERSNRVLAGTTLVRTRDPLALAYGPLWNEEPGSRTGSGWSKEPVTCHSSSRPHLP